MSESGQILVLEDDEGIRESLCLALELEGYSVKARTNGAEGLRALSEAPLPCLILLDLMMPVMDGWSFVEALRRNLSLASIPIVVVSAFSDKTDGMPLVRNVLRKPVDLGMLLHVVRQYCTPTPSV